MSEEYDLLEGLDPTNEVTISAAQLLQLIRQAVPRNNRAMFVVQEDEPDVVATPRLKRYAWVKPSEDHKIIRVWVEGEEEWQPQSLADDTIGTAQLQDQSVNLDKLFEPPNGSALMMIRVKADESGWELVTFTIPDNSLSLDKLDKGVDNDGKFVKVADDGSVIAFEELLAENYISNGSILPAKLASPLSASKGFVLMEHPTVAGVLIWDRIRPVNINPGPNNTRIVTNSDGVVAWVSDEVNSASVVGFKSGAIDLPANSVRVVAHGLGAMPKTFGATFVCVGDNQGYSVGDELDLNSVSFLDSSGLAAKPPVWANATQVGVSFGPASFSVYQAWVINKSNGTWQALSLSNWKLRLWAIK